MTKFLALLLCVLPLCGCATANMAKLAKALANDPATVNLRITSVYGTLTFTRTNPSTNTSAHSISPDGTVTVSAGRIGTGDGNALEILIRGTNIATKAIAP